MGNNTTTISGGVNEVEQIGCSSDLFKTVIKAFEKKDEQISEVIRLIGVKDSQISEVLNLIKKKDEQIDRQLSRVK
ncbi:MAG: hypothetical protein R3Y50_08060 [Rikenellaceae bacterium]